MQKFLQIPALVKTDGVLSGHTDIANENGKVSANGQMTLDKPKLHGIDVGYPINADYNVSEDLPNDLLHIDKGAIKLGQTPVSVTGTVNHKPTPAQLDVTVKADNVAIAEIARLAAAAGIAFAPGTAVNGQINANIKAQGSADKPALNGTIAATNIQVSGKEIAEAGRSQSNQHRTHADGDPFRQFQCDLGRNDGCGAVLRKGIHVECRASGRDSESSASCFA